MNPVAVASLQLEPSPLDPGQIVAGAPVVSQRELWRSPDGGTATGVWQITPGEVTDTEADEVFTVIHGRATIHVDGGPTYDVGPGDVAVLHAGDHTRWVVHETLRKVYTVALG
ncbi:cupin domain-containing protein [Cryptosporangium minutisporangium]|uniref:Cupin domain-containing protein n=1 Tax=Cryptosporangium minutisporangium TaxID=113569 RepID=A0ABP6T6B7_9ACTN